MKKILRFKFIIAAAVLYAAVFIADSKVFFSAVDYTKNFLIEMFQVLPPVLIITALMAVWVPADAIRKALGSASGFRGRILSLAIGSLSAGPIYAAFPATLMLFQKGASISNLVIILSSWAVIKVPMLLIETKFLGFKFMIIRLLLSVPAILITGILAERLIPRRCIIQDTAETAEQMIVLPEMNCGACGCCSCSEFREAVINKIKTPDDCVFSSRQAEGVKT